MPVEEYRFSLKGRKVVLIIKPGAIANCEPCQVRKEAALSRAWNVPPVHLV